MGKRSGYCWNLWITISLLTGSIITCGDCIIAQAQIVPDGTLGNDSSILKQNVIIDGELGEQIDGGVRRETNIFHSFEEFNVGEDQRVYFNSPLGVNNIFSRVTGGRRSEVLGKLGVLGSANLFLVNPNGIIFGPKASLDLKGSLIVSTASRLNFADGTEFSATATQSSPLLTMSVPVGLQFGKTAEAIQVQESQIDLGLVVHPGKTLGLLGGELSLEGGYLNAPRGRIELGSVASNSLVSLNPLVEGWSFGYEGVQNFQNIKLLQGSFNRFASVVDTSGEGGGGIQVQGRRVVLTDGSQIITRGTEQGGNLIVTAVDSVLVTGPDSALSSSTTSAGDAGNIIINTKRLLISDGAFVSTESSRERESSEQVTVATGRAGNLTVNASESVDIKNGFLLSNTQGLGDAGNITINTGKLLLTDGGQVLASTYGGGQAGKLTVNASELVELNGTNSALFSGSNRVPGNAGSLEVNTGNLIVQNGAEVSVSSEGTGDAGSLQLQTRFINLDRGKLTATSASGEGGNITVQARNVQLRHESSISTTAGTRSGPGNGGDITIDTGTLVGLENSDITANAFEGTGGTINITAQGIFGLVKLDLEDLQSRLETTNPEELDPNKLPSSDITAISQTSPSLRGQVTINRPEFDPNQGLVTLPTQPVNVTGLIAQGCPADGGNLASQFVVTGRGGLPDNPSQTLSSDTVWSDLRSPTRLAVYRPSSESATQPTTNSTTEQLVEAQGWMTNDKGEVVLTAAVTSTTPHSPWMTPTGCHAP